MMETWAIVTLVLGTSAVSALLTFFITNMQVRHSDKRLEKELERAREADCHQWRRKVRGKPLLKLRNELARMATKLEELVTVALRLEGGGEGATKELQEAKNNWSAYMASGDFTQAILIQYDTDLVNKVEEIRKIYQKCYVYLLRYPQIDDQKLIEAVKDYENIRTKITEVQELINKKLEEL